MSIPRQVLAGPHDKLFKFAFGMPEHAASILRSALPATVAQRIDWSSLHAIPISFVDEELLERYADLLFGAQLDGKNALIYFLYEHQSTHDPWMALRLVDYCVRAWNDWRRKNPDAERLPAIVPVILHHSEKGWSGGTALSDLLDLDLETKTALKPHLLDVRFLLDDITRQSDEQIHSRALTELAELVVMAFKHLPYGRDPLHLLDQLAPLMLRVMTAPHGMAALTALIRYTLQVSEVEVQALRELVAYRLGKPAEEAAMNTAEKLEQKGRAEGRAEGRTEGGAELLGRQLMLKFKLPELPAAVQQRLRTASVDELGLWAERILSASSVDEVLS